jgi:hypothetical protein
MSTLMAAGTFPTVKSYLITLRLETCYRTNSAPETAPLTETAGGRERFLIVAGYLRATVKANV